MSKLSNSRPICGNDQFHSAWEWNQVLSLYRGKLDSIYKLWALVLDLYHLSRIKYEFYKMDH